MSLPPAKREDLLVSICFAEITPSEEAFAAVRRAAAAVGRVFRYWEVLLVADTGSNAKAFFDRCAMEIKNVRVLRVRGASGYYRRRSVAAAEAIGDIVILTETAECDAVDLLGLIERAVHDSAVVVCSRDEPSHTAPLFKAFGAVSGFRVSPLDMLTAAFPRTLLNRLLAHPEQDLALRFPPRNEGMPVRRIPIRPTDAMQRDARKIGRRLFLMHKLMVNAAPTVLMGVALLSSVMVLVSAVYALYAVIVWLTYSDVQPGWFSTSLTQSMIAGFLGCALLGISMGMQKIIDRLEPALGDVIVDEYSNVDLFGDVHDLNVDVSVAELPQRGAPEPVRRPAAQGAIVPAKQAGGARS